MDVAAIPVPDTIPDVQYSSVISNVLFKIKTLTATIWTGTTTCNAAVDYYCYASINPISFNKATALNCRGAPQ